MGSEAATLPALVLVEADAEKAAGSGHRRNTHLARRQGVRRPHLTPHAAGSDPRVVWRVVALRCNLWLDVVRE